MSASAIVLAGLAGVSVTLFFYYRKSQPKLLSKNRETAYEQLVGSTPIVYLESLSRITGVHIYGKCEFLNPGGSVKDRVALALVRYAKMRGFTGIVEATSGSTGISLAMAAKALGLDVRIFMPNDVSKEKRHLIETLGGTVVLVPPVSIAHPGHMCRRAEKFSRENPEFFYTDQFETLLNKQVHATGTGLELLQQLPNIQVFVGSAGTGGTVAGVSRALKLLKHRPLVILADPQGSALASRVNHGVLFNVKDREGYRTKEIKDTITEGIGLNRLTANFQQADIDYAVTVTDQEALIMSRYLLDKEGLFLGSSSAVNLVGLVKAVRRGWIQKDAVVCTILCDSGQRHVSKFWNDDFVQAAGFIVKKGRMLDSDLDCIG